MDKKYAAVRECQYYGWRLMYHFVRLVFYCGVIRNFWCFNCGCFVVLSATISAFGSSLSRLVDFGSNRCLVSVIFATLLFTHQAIFLFIERCSLIACSFLIAGFPFVQWNLSGRCDCPCIDNWRRSVKISSVQIDNFFKSNKDIFGWE